MSHAVRSYNERVRRDATAVWKWENPWSFDELEKKKKKISDGPSHTQLARMRLSNWL